MNDGVGQGARSQNWREGPLQLVTGKKTKICLPVRIWGFTVWKWAGRKKNYHLGNPNYGILSATIWVLTDTGGGVGGTICFILNPT